MSIPTLPTAPNTSRPTSFSAEMDAWIAALADWTTAVNSVGSAFGVSLTGTSTTSLTIGTGAKSLTVETGLAYVPGMGISIAATASPSNRMLCTVASYDTGTGALVVNSDTIGGSGTYAAWSVGPGAFSIDTSSLVTLTTAQTLTNKTLTAPIFDGVPIEDVYTITDSGSVDINPANGGIQLWTLGASRTPSATSFAAGQSVTLMIDDGSAYSITWSTIGVTWINSAGAAPTLKTSGYTPIVLWKTGTTVYGVA